MTTNPQYILGLQTFATPDPGACIFKVMPDGDFDYVAISEERLSREKYSYKFPLYAIDYCLRHFGLNSVAEIDLLATDYIRLDRWEFSGPGYNIAEFDYLKKTLAIPSEKIYIVNHHQAHAAGVYYMSGFDEAAVLIVDGNGSELETQTFYRAQGQNIETLAKSHHYGVGYCYSSVTSKILNFGTGGEGKTMGLAPYGEAHPPVLDIRRHTDGIHTNYSEFMRRLPLSDVLNQVDPANRLYPFRKTYRQRGKDESPLDPYYSRAAFEIQEETETVLVELANELYRQSPSRNLCLSGGVMLNCVTNRLILDRTPFENIFIFPACGDTGVPFGACLQALYNHPDFTVLKPRRKVLTHAYTGIDYGNRIAPVLEHYNIPSETMDVRQTAQLIADGQIVAWFQGGSEYGPRALGHRSILADSRSAAIKDQVNDRVKHREAFRPFAPAVLAERATDYFDLPCASPFMLLVADALEPEKIPSVIHVDDSARVQTVTRKDNGLYYDVIKAFEEITGVAVIMNTSFNVAGEPIVETPRDALITALGTSIDYLVLHDRLIDCRLAEGPAIRERMLADRQNDLAAERTRILRQNHPGFDETARDAYVARGNEMSIWWTKYRAQYELEKRVIAWRGANRPVFLVGENRHVDYLKAYINDFEKLDVAGFIDTGPSDAPVASLEKIDWSPLRNGHAAEVVVCSWERQFMIRDAVLNSGWKGELYLIYDNMGRSLEDIYPQPVVGASTS